MLEKIKGKRSEKISGWYARFPVFVEKDIFFVAGNDLFKLEQGSTRPQLYFQATGNIHGLVAYGNKIACISDEDGGPDIYIFDTITRQLERITYFEKDARIIEFDDNVLCFVSAKDAAFRHDMSLYKYDFATKQTQAMDISQISWYARDKKSNIKNFKLNDLIIQRYGYGYVNWKRYKGGTAGSLWKCDKRFLEVKGNCLRPFWNKAGNRLFFLHDNGISGNIFSCDANGNNLTQHTHYTDFQVQDLSHLDDKFIYSKNGQIGIYDAAQQQNTLLQLDGYMPHPDTRLFITHAQKYVTEIATDGNNLALAIRGHVYYAGLWSGGMQQLSDELRYRIAGLLHDGRVYAFKEPPESIFCIYDKTGKETQRLKIDCGKIAFVKAAPTGDLLAYVNHRHELHIFNTKTGKDQIIFKANQRLNYCDWSADSNFLVYSATINTYQSKIVIYDLGKKKHHDITSGRYRDYAPTFDPSGKYIAFLSNRGTQCAYDGLRFDLTFNSTSKPYVVSLQKNQNVMMPWKNAKEEIEETDNEKKSKKKEKLIIDFDDIASRILPLSIKERDYHELYALNDARLVLVSSAGRHDDEDEDEPAGGHTMIEIFNFKNLSTETCYRNLSYFDIGTHRDYCVIEEDDKLKVLKVGEKPEENGYKKGNVFDLTRWKAVIDPRAEWRQMAYELWYLMQEFFWTEDLDGIDWDSVWKKYQPYIDNIRTIQELYDIMAEIQGELGTSHAFVLEKGNERLTHYRGYLGADTSYDARMKAYRINKIFDANLEVGAISPLKAANNDVQEGEYVFAIDGETLNEKNSLEEMLSNKPNTWITLEIGKTKATKRTVELKTIASDNMLRYKAWVDANREHVKKTSKGKLGYIHISDMQKRGFKEFYQQYLCEYNHQAIIIDVRYNRGGNVSCLLLDQLIRRRVGVDHTRWHGLNELPNEASRGAYVLLTNAHTASDGEMFSHQFQLLGLGKVIGERTWGGVVGIMPRYRLVDGTLTSQPEFATWFMNNGYELENTGVIPDIEIVNSNAITHDINKDDAQLKKAIELALQIKSTCYDKQVRKTKD